MNEEGDTTGMGLTSSTSGDTTDGDASGIPKEKIQVSHSQSNQNQALVPFNQPKKGEFAQRAIMQRVTVPVVLQPVHPMNPFEPHARSFPADIQIVQIGDTNEWMCNVCKGAVFDNFVEACMHEMICKSANGQGCAVGLSAKFPAQVSNVFPSVRTFGLPNTTVAPRVGPMLPMQSTLHSAVFPSSTVRVPAPTRTMQGPALCETATASTTSALGTAIDLNDTAIHPKETKEVTKDITLDVSLVPENRNLLSDYNYILAQNIEFFETPSSYAVPASLLGNMKELPTTKIGLRCIHCISNGVHITAASFFPSSIASLSSGMGTIGSRHFLGGKCTFIPKEVVANLASVKRHSQQQTRSPGKIGLDAYCKKVAKSNKMRDHEIGGVYISNQGLAEKDGGSTSSETSPRAQVIKSCSKSVPIDKAGQETFSGRDVSNLIRKPAPPRDPIPDRKDPSAFVEGSVEHFWECKHCNSLPFHWRATGSVVFCATKPTIELVGKHLSVCQGKKPLSIPRNAAIKIKTSGDCENGPSVIVQWCNDEGKRKSSRTKRQSLGPGENAKKKRKTMAAVHVDDVQSGVDEDVLALPQNKALTTDFAFFTVLQLKKCYLTKSGGSRGNCPIGYPGLACSHCVGSPNQRRFFYTSADHLRNSFSHIPSHLLSCSKSPPEVKARIEEYKSLRNRQKAQLKAGDHKLFIDRVWTKLHGEGGGKVPVAEDEYVVEDASDDDRSITSLSVDFEFNPKDDYLHESLDGRFLESKEIAIETSDSAILSSSDRKLSTNYVFFALLQLIPKQYVIDSEGTLSEIESTDEDGGKNDETGYNITEKEDESAPKTLQDCCTVTESATGNNERDDPLIDDNLKTETRPESDANNDHEEEKIKDPEMFNTLVCKYCKNEDMQAAFLPESSEDLRTSFSDVPAHLASCDKCPESVKTKLETLKAFRPIQEALLKRGAQKKLMKNVWNRVENYFQEPTEETIPPELRVPEFHNTEVVSTELLTEDDRVLVSEFTFYTMEQMVPCILDNSGNGSRSMFTFGFPGLGCKHCAGKTNARKFFYRTSEILSGNYAHIPNHVLSCRHAPLEVRQTLAAKKKIHPSQKQRLSRGSQRIFFERVFRRLHAKRA